MRATLTLLVVITLFLFEPIVANKLFYTTWAPQSTSVNSSLVFLDLATGQQGVLYSQLGVVTLSTFNFKANLFHLVDTSDVTGMLNTIDMQGNLISSVSTAATLQCLKYSASKNMLIGAKMAINSQVTIVLVDYQTGHTTNIIKLDSTLSGDFIRSCDIDDSSGRLVLHLQSSDNQERLVFWDYQANRIVGRYNVTFNSENEYLANVAFSGYHLACIVGSYSNGTWTAQLGKFYFNGPSGTANPTIISAKPVDSFVVGFAFNSVNALFYTLSEHPMPAPFWYIDAYDRNGFRVGQTSVLFNPILQPHDLVVVG